MGKFLKILIILLDIAVVVALIAGIWYVATHVGAGTNPPNVGDIFGGVQ